jgi:hypothetical protein
MMPMPMPRLVPAPQEWTLAARFSPFQAITRFAEMQVGMTLAAAELALALSPLGLAGAVGRRAASSEKPVAAGSVVPMTRPRVVAVPTPSAPKPVPPKPRPMRSAAKKTARPAAPVAPKLARPQPKAAPAPVEVAIVAPAVVKAEAPANAPAKARRVPKPPVVAKPEPKVAAPKATRAAAAKPESDPARPRARRAPAKPSQPFKVEE